MCWVGCGWVPGQRVGGCGSGPRRSCPPKGGGVWVGSHPNSTAARRWRPPARRAMRRGRASPAARTRIRDVARRSTRGRCASIIFLAGLARAITATCLRRVARTVADDRSCGRRARRAGRPAGRRAVSRPFWGIASVNSQHCGRVGGGVWSRAHGASRGRRWGGMGAWAFRAPYHTLPPR